MLGAALGKFLADRYIKRRKPRTFCKVVSALGCLEFPYGLVPGVLRFIVLGRQPVAKQFITKS
jgi:hypothetical protein